LERKTTETYKDQLKVHRPNLSVLGSYTTNNTKLDHLCVCGNIWHTTPTSLLNSKPRDKCPKCPNKVYSTTKSDEQYKKEIESKGCYALEPYITAHTKILHKCKHCDNEWMAEPRSIIQNGIACKACWKTTRKSEDFYKKELKNTKYVLLGKYTNALTKTLHRCTECANEWSIKPNDVLTGRGGCPSCSLTGFDSSKPGILYFVKINDGLFKLGITNKTVRQRFKSDWNRFNIEIIWELKFEKGKIAQKLERRLLKSYKYLLINTGLLISGNTETMSEEIPCPV
jgi:hypothetical protein